MPNSTRPPPMRTASMMYTTWTVRRRPAPRRSNSNSGPGVVEVELVAGRFGLVAPSGTRCAAIEHARHKDRALVEHEQRHHHDQHRDRVLSGHRHRDDRDHQDRVAAVLPQLTRGDDPRAGKADDPDRDLE